MGQCAGVISGGQMTSRVRRWKRKMDEAATRAKCETPTLFQDSDNLMHCQNPECKARLSFWKLVYHAYRKKKGEMYRVRCKHCGTINVIEKGRMGRELDGLLNYDGEEDKG